VPAGSGEPATSLTPRGPVIASMPASSPPRTSRSLRMGFQDIVIFFPTYLLFSRSHLSVDKRSAYTAIFPVPAVAIMAWFTGASAQMAAQQQTDTSAVSAAATQVQIKSAHVSLALGQLREHGEVPQGAAPRVACTDARTGFPSAAQLCAVSSPAAAAACESAPHLQACALASRTRQVQEIMLDLQGTCVDAQQRLALEAGSFRPPHRGEAAELQVRGVCRVEEGRMQQRLQLRGAIQVGLLPRLLQEVVP
jgi:hypothetical protein